VSGGQYNLSLFVKLFWLVVTAFLAVSLFNWPISFLIRGIYVLPKGTKGRACLLEEQQYMGVRRESEKTNMMNLVQPTLIIVFMSWQRFSAKRFMRGLCPRGRMSCVGKFRRNVLSLESSYRLLMALCCSRAGGTLLAYYASQLSPTAHFWLWNTTATIWGEVGWMVLPWLLAAPQSISSSAPVSQFYVRKPVLQPRPENGVSWDLVNKANVTNVKECSRYRNI
jgi:hypothetical protein